MKRELIESNCEKDTRDLGFRLGQAAEPGQVYTLVGDLGVGKTVFTQGLAAGLGIEEPVSSPTFTIVQVYEDGRLPFYHFDVYRIGDVEEMDEIGYEDYVYGQGVSLIEWANLIEEILRGGGGGGGGGVGGWGVGGGRGGGGGGGGGEHDRGGGGGTG